MTTSHHKNTKGMEDIRVINKREDAYFNIAGGLYRTIISGKETDEKYAVIEMHVPPGGGPTPHAHKDIEEVFYVTKGQVEFRTESGSYCSKEGDMIRIPRGGSVHAFKNTSESDAVLICTVYPAGMEEMFAEINASDLSKAKAIGEKFGNQFFSEDYFNRRN